MGCRQHEVKAAVGRRWPSYRAMGTQPWRAHGPAVGQGQGRVRVVQPWVDGHPTMGRAWPSHRGPPASRGVGHRRGVQRVPHGAKPLVHTSTSLSPKPRGSSQRARKGQARRQRWRGAAGNCIQPTATGQGNNNAGLHFISWWRRKKTSQARAPACREQRWYRRPKGAGCSPRPADPPAPLSAAGQ